MLVILFQQVELSFLHLVTATLEFEIENLFTFIDNDRN